MFGPRRFALTVLAVCAAACLATPPIFAGDDKPAPQPAWSVTPHLPAETLAVVTMPDVKTMIEKFSSTGMWQIMNNSEVRAVFRAQLMDAQYRMAMAELFLGQKITDLAALLSQGEVTFAMVGLDKTGPDGKPLPDMILSVQAKEKIADLVAEVDKRLDQLKAATNNALQITETPIGNTKIRKLEVPGVPFVLHYCIADSNLLVGLGEGQLEKVLMNREKAKLLEGKPAAAGAPEMLSQVPSYKASVAKAGPSTDLMLFVNVDSVLKNKLLNIRKNTEREIKEWGMLGIDSIRALSYAVGIKDKGIRETFFVDAPAANRKGLITLLEGAPLDANALAAAPKSSLVATAVQLQPEKIFEKLLDVATLDNPNAKQDVQAMLLMIGQQLNVDLRKEVFNALDGRMTFSVSMTPRHPKLGLSFPQPLLTLGVKDPNSLKTLITALKEAGKETHDFKETLDGDNTIVSVRERFPEGRDPGQFVYTIQKNELLLSIYPLALRNELRRRTAALGSPNEPGGGSLADDPDFKSARAKLSGNPQGMFYLDTGAIAVVAYEVLIPIAQLESVKNRRLREIDLAALPTSDVVLSNIGGTVFSTTTDADGIMAEGYSPTGGMSLVLAAIPAAIRQQRENAGRQEEGALNDREENGLKLKAALDAYAKDNAGKYPPTLAELNPKYMPLTADQIANVVYRGKQDAPNKVVAHSSEKERGPLTLVLQDGSVVTIGRGRLGKALAQGVGPEMIERKREANTQGAVKPPAAPDGF